MSTTGLQGLEHTLELTHVWINDPDAALEWNNRARAYRLLKSVMHAWRDWLQLEEMAHFGSQLPTPLRAGRQEPRSGSAASLHSLQDPLPSTSQAAMAVVELLSKKITPGEGAGCPTTCVRSGRSRTLHRGRCADNGSRTIHRHDHDSRESAAWIRTNGLESVLSS
jgi:uncharacterized protein (DUF2267 family)